MANTIKLKRGSGSDPSSSDLSVGELAIRTDTALLFTKNDGGSIVPIGISDGDKGDITVSSSGGTFTIDNDAVTYAKIQNVSATNRILGRDSSGAGVIEEITPANLRTMLNVEDGATADQTKSDIDGLGIAASTAATLATARTIAGVSFNGSANISLNNNAITNGAGYVTSSVINALNASNLSSGTIPDARFPSTLPAVDGSNLTGISAGATGGGSDEIFYENGQNVTTNYTITNGKNAMAAGPITINSGVTVTVGSGETLTIV
jgi:hypothetical protein